MPGLPSRSGPAAGAPRPSDAEDEPSTPRTLEVRDEEAARWLLRPASLRQIEPFLGASRSVGEAAALTGDKPNTVLRRAQRLLRLGLLEVAEIVPRRGRPVRRYRTTAEVFFIPFEATGADTLETVMAEREAYWERLLRRNVVRARLEAMGTWGTRVYRDARGRLQVQTAVAPDENVTLLDPDLPAALSAWRDRIELDFADAKALQRALFELVRTYGRHRGSQRYVVHVGIAAVLSE